MRTVKTFSKVERNQTFTAEAYTEDGMVWRWVSNGSCVPLDAAKGYGMPIDREAQESARSEELGAFLADYRKRMESYQPSAEELYEMRAAFGEGAEVVNVITGQRTRL